MCGSLGGGRGAGLTADSENGTIDMSPRAFGITSETVFRLSYECTVYDPSNRFVVSR